MSKVNDTKKTIMHAAAKNDTCILFFSGSGKDSIALLHLITPHFKKVVAVYMYLVPDLSFISPFLNWAKTFENVEVIQYPHPDKYNHIKFGIYSPFSNSKVKTLTFKDYEKYLIKRYGTDVIFWGMKLVDSFVRRGMFTKAAKSEIFFDYGKYYPLVNWTNKEVLAYIKQNRLPYPLKLGSTRASSGVSLRLPVMAYIKNHYHNDYQKIINEYPLLDLKVTEYEQQQRTE